MKIINCCVADNFPDNNNWGSLLTCYVLSLWCNWPVWTVRWYKGKKRFHRLWYFWLEKQKADVIFKYIIRALRERSGTWKVTLVYAWLGYQDTTKGWDCSLEIFLCKLSTPWSHVVHGYKIVFLSYLLVLEQNI